METETNTEVQPEATTAQPSADGVKPEAPPAPESGSAASAKRPREEDGTKPPLPQRRFILERGSEPALGMLAALGHGRQDALEGLAERARARLIEAVPTMPPARIRKLLLASFAHIESPRLQAVAVAALAHAPELPPDVLAALVGPQRALLATLPLRVRQRVWETEEPPTLFLEATHEMIIALQAEGAGQLSRVALREAAEVAPKRRRAESHALQELIGLVASSPLYTALTRLCMDIFQHSADASACASTAGLRADLTMALHELDDVARPVARWDPLHTAVCCVDAALREQKLEPRAVQILLGFAHAAGLPVLLDPAATAAAAAEGATAPAAAHASPPAFFLEHVENAPTPHSVLLELAMLLSPPPVVQLITEVVLTRLEAVVERGALPGTDKELLGLVPLLTLALKAGPFARAGHMPPADKWLALMSLLMHKVLPIVAELLADDRIVEEQAKLDELSGGRRKLGALTKAPAAARSSSAGAGGSGARSILEVSDVLGSSSALEQPPARSSDGARALGVPSLPASLEIMLRKGHGRTLVLLYALRRVEAADVERSEQLLPLLTETLGAELRSHEDFAGGLVSALMADPLRRLTPRMARASVTHCLVPLSKLLPHAHKQLLRLLQSQWRVLNTVPAVETSAADLLTHDGSLRTTSSIDAGKGHGEVVLTLLQVAAREAHAAGAREEAEEAQAAVKRAYARLERAVPALLGKAA